MRTSLLLCLSLLAYVSAPALAQEVPIADQREALKDWESLGTLNKKVAKAIHTWSYRDEVREKYAEALTAIESYQQNEQASVESQLVAFEKKYGGSVNAVRQRYEAIFPFATSGYRLPEELKEEYERVASGQVTPERLLRETRAELKGLEDTRINTAESLVGQVRQSLGVLDSFTPEQQVKSLVEMSEDLDFALRFNKDNAEARAMVEQVEAKIKASESAMQQVYAARRFPETLASFSGPGTTDELAAAALQWFENHSEWGKASPPERPILVTVTGDWIVARVNILGEPVQWGLPIHLAIVRDADPDMAVAFSLTLVTEQAHGVAKAPPFKAVWVGSSKKIPLANIQGASGGSAEASGFALLGGLCCCGLVLVVLAGGGVFLYMRSQKAADTAT